MNLNKLTTPENGLSLQFVTATATEVDWTVGDDIFDGYEIVLPTPTYGEVAELDSDLFLVNPAARDWPLTDDDLDTFRNADSFHDYQARAEPMMSYAWPVALAYGLDDEQAVADLIARYAPNCTLVRFPGGLGGDDDATLAIALNGGGMDLSDNIVAAYLCCGCVPPESLLSRQAGVMSAQKRDSLGPILLQAYSRAGEWLEARKAGLAREVDKLFAIG